MEMAVARERESRSSRNVKKFKKGKPCIAQACTTAGVLRGKTQAKQTNNMLTTFLHTHRAAVAAG